MKECCKDAFEKPSKWQRWKTRVIYLVVVILLVFIAWSQFNSVKP